MFQMWQSLEKKNSKRAKRTTRVKKEGRNPKGLETKLSEQMLFCLSYGQWENAWTLARAKKCKTWKEYAPEKMSLSHENAAGSWVELCRGGKKTLKELKECIMQECVQFLTTNFGTSGIWAHKRLRSQPVVVLVYATFALLRSSIILVCLQIKPIRRLPSVMHVVTGQFVYL